MLRGPLGKDDYRPQFSGHETFPLRYGWLKKAYDAVSKTEGVGSRNVFLDFDAIAQFGVGQEHGRLHAPLGARLRHPQRPIG